MTHRRKRRIDLFCCVINEGQMVILRMPKDFVPWETIRREMNASLRREHGIRANQVHAVESLAGDVDGDADGGEFMRICERAFAGDVTVLKRFALHAWNEETMTFDLARAACRTEQASTLQQCTTEVTDPGRTEDRENDVKRIDGNGRDDRTPKGADRDDPAIGHAVLIGTTGSGKTLHPIGGRV